MVQMALILDAFLLSAAICSFVVFIRYYGLFLPLPFSARGFIHAVSLLCNQYVVNQLCLARLIIHASFL